MSLKSLPIREAFLLSVLVKSSEYVDETAIFRHYVRMFFIQVHTAIIKRVTMNKTNTRAAAGTEDPVGKESIRNESDSEEFLELQLFRIIKD